MRSAEQADWARCARGLVTVTTTEDESSAGLRVVTIAATDAKAVDNPLDIGTLVVTRSGNTSAPLTASYSAGGTVTAGVDYQALAGSVTTPANASSASIVVTRSITRRTRSAST